MTSIEEIEKALLGQIELLGEDGILDDPEKAKLAIEKSKAISDLTNSFIGVRNSMQNEARLRLEAAKFVSTADGYTYQKYLGVEEDSPQKFLTGKK